jgi:uncharacterized protein (DUF4415 family)
MKKTKAQKAKAYADDAPLTKAELATMRPLRGVFPDLADWSRRKRAKKGEEHKQAVSIRLSPEVITFFKARGSGWQTRIDRALMAIVEASR